MYCTCCCCWGGGVTAIMRGCACWYCCGGAWYCGAGAGVGAGAGAGARAASFFVNVGSKPLGIEMTAAGWFWTETVEGCP